MPEQNSMDNLQEISQAIESTYNELNTVVQEIGSLKEIIDGIKNDSKNVREQYTQVLDNTKLKETKKDYEKTVNSMEKDLKQIQTGVINIQTMKEEATDNLEKTLQKVSNLESLLDTLNSKSKTMQNKISKSMNTLELNHGQLEKKANRALRQIELNYHEDKYDEILHLQKENNKLLKSLKEKERKSVDQPESKSKQNSGRKRSKSYTGVSDNKDKQS